MTLLQCRRWIVPIPARYSVSVCNKRVTDAFAASPPDCKVGIHHYTVQLYCLSLKLKGQSCLTHLTSYHCPLTYARHLCCNETGNQKRSPSSLCSQHSRAFPRLASSLPPACLAIDAATSGCLPCSTWPHHHLRDGSGLLIHAVLDVLVKTASLELVPWCPCWSLVTF